MSSSSGSAELDNKIYKEYMASLENAVAGRPASKLHFIHRYFCDDSECRMTKGQQLLFRDRNHLNINGSRLAGTRLVADNPDLFP
jgi:SGNH domain (fused to AT3 domains)